MPYSFAAHLARFGPDADVPPMDLARARSYCARLTRSHYENFTVASALLPRRLTPHFYPVYSYCRWADDLGDETGGGKRSLELLAWWRQELLDCYAGKLRHPVMIALKPTIDRFRIPKEPFLDLLCAFEQDQRVCGYASFDDLLDYCRRSANPVGRLVLHLGESFDEERAELSDSICTGLQLANFWQDVKRDYCELGRVYLPECDRIEFGYDSNDLAACRFTPQFAKLMRFQVDRARRFLEGGRPLLAMVPQEIRIDIELFLEGGLAILRRIEALGYDVWTTRPKVGKRAKAGLLIRALCGKAGAGAPARIAPANGASASKNGAAAIVGTGFAANGARVNGARVFVDSRPASRAWCRRLTRRTAKNFYWSFQVLPRDQRRAMDVLYAFMRVTDDLADEAGEIEAKRAALTRWRDGLDCALLRGVYGHPLHAALHETVERYGIPSSYLHAVIDGVETDLEPVGFNTFDDLYGYCYKVASAVGLCCISIWGFRDDQAKEFAESAGIAFQLTNILRDLGEDLQRGRVYLPAEDLERFRCPPEIWPGQGEAFRRLMRFQVERARGYYREAERLLPLLYPSGRAVFRVMMKIYGGLLEEIEARGYDVFRERVRLTRWRKLRSLLLAFPVRWGWL